MSATTLTSALRETIAALQNERGPLTAGQDRDLALLIDMGYIDTGRRVTDKGRAALRGDAPANERDTFEAWFATMYGPKPPGDPETLRANASGLLLRAAAVVEWQAKYNAALAAWHERHGRGES